MVKLISTVLISLLVSLAPVKAARLVLVHGLAGFGPEELGPIDYWNDNEQYFIDRGIDVFESTVGPVSSNWDRACELYAQIKGTVVDYGKAHSERHGHKRFGRNFTGKGYAPDWDENNKLHFVGHSMGGQTIRELERLIQEGDAAELAATGDDTSPLFKKQGNWIKSMSTLSTPHDGTPLVKILGDGMVALIKAMIIGFAGISSGSDLEDFYDLDLDQWDLGRHSGEKFFDYLSRVLSSPIWKDNIDFANYDLTIEGSIAAQQKGQHAYPGTHYAGYATEQTEKVIFTSFQIPSLKMSLPMQPFGTMLGSILNSDKDLRENDGLVPLEASKCPQAGYSGVSCTEFTSQDHKWEAGKWHWEKVSKDHMQVIGFTIFQKPDQVYERIANRIVSIEPTLRRRLKSLRGN
mmetsp:Transcript_15523/g.25412  ORF Transcript_15523/g.25412 Transcript_15523/m.25412 type:complete len:406 (+) Transcript_15523:828-2045(+)|eukprot:CAMPEP_0203751934 /NCGR_PEP_ID=MMETSP0098-20131031/5924_1 /ASSEMBLY_ACC=CAM_ASM_000208 /TAXON_ID=96639 /ORGANISM=" , Strain NY0313808BC1" /LENGTH=405 /DNA_ID=CAMNT_0050641873 /DNA_START=63 /DNA_END=1280 /DNA_ORIENTATION=-